ncbi:MAG: NUDIX domain-containing protein [Candidatus Altiarchaeales archaeon]|nr:NUDIX domain-containing protein [Candidatus Altiarchaeales archaeon]
MVEDVFDVVDEDDNVVGRATRSECHSSLLIHRSVMFFILDHVDRVFVNQRSPKKDVLPGRWSIVLGGHVDCGESYDEAVLREFQEETGLNAEPVAVGFFRKYIPQEREHVRVYAFHVNGKPKLDETETVGGEFRDYKDLEDLFTQHDFLPETGRLYEMLGDYLGK